MKYQYLLKLSIACAAAALLMLMAGGCRSAAKTVREEETVVSASSSTQTSHCGEWDSLSIRESILEHLQRNVEVEIEFERVEYSADLDTLPGRPERGTRSILKGAVRMTGAGVRDRSKQTVSQRTGIRTDSTEIVGASGTIDQTVSTVNEKPRKVTGLRAPALLLIAVAAALLLAIPLKRFLSRRSGHR